MKNHKITFMVIMNLLLVVNLAYSAAAPKGAGSTRMMIPDMKQSTIKASQESDDHGETAKAATSITPNSIISGAFHDYKNVDSFKVELPAEGTLTVFTLSKIDTEGTLEDRYGSLVWENDGGSDDNFLISEYLEAGIYYISVSGAETTDATYFLVSEFISNDSSLDAQAKRLLEINRERVTANLREIRELEKLNQSLMDRSAPSSDLHGFDRELPQSNLQNDPCPDPRDCEGGAGGSPWNRYGSQPDTSSPLPPGLDPRGVAGHGLGASRPRSWDPPGDRDAFTIEYPDGTRSRARGSESWYWYNDGGAPVYRSDTDDHAGQITWGSDGKRTGTSVTYHEDEGGFYAGYTEEDWEDTDNGTVRGRSKRYDSEGNLVGDTAWELDPDTGEYLFIKNNLDSDGGPKEPIEQPAPHDGVYYGRGDCITPTGVNLCDERGFSPSKLRSMISQPGPSTPESDESNPLSVGTGGPSLGSEAVTNTGDGSFGTTGGMRSGSGQPYDPRDPEYFNPPSE